MIYLENFAYKAYTFIFILPILLVLCSFNRDGMINNPRMNQSKFFGGMWRSAHFPGITFKFCPVTPTITKVCEDKRFTGY